MQLSSFNLLEDPLMLQLFREGLGTHKLSGNRTRLEIEILPIHYVQEVRVLASREIIVE